jgi:ABC-2 type transport system permease protein
VSSFTGTMDLTRFSLRRDRVRIAVWVVAIVALVVVTAASTKGLYPTQADLDQAAAASEGNPAALAFNGPAVALDTLGGQVAFQIGAVGLAIVGLMSLLMVGRLTRGEEESGRLELIRSMAVGRHAPLAAAVLVVGAMDVVVGVVVAGALVAMGLPTAGSLVLGASYTVLGLSFIGIAAVTSQVVDSARVASGLAGAVLGASFAVRAVGDVGNGAVSWLSPIGIAQKARPYGGEVWWPLGVGLALTVLTGAAAAWLAARRDFGAGMVAPRAGPATAPASLDRPFGLAVRLQRGTVLWWAVGVLLTGIAYGSIANSIQDFVADNQAMTDMFAAAGGASLTDAYLATSLLILAILTGGAALQMTLRLRSEEAGDRAEAILATPTSRGSWMASHVAIGLGGSALIMVAGGFGLGAVYGAIIGDADQVPRLMAASLAQIPAIWVLVGVASALFGLVPRIAVAAWAVLAGGLVVGMFGTLLDLPGWVRDVSPFQHTPAVPAAGFTVLPLVVLLGIGGGLTALGFAGLRRRDIG